MFDFFDKVILDNTIKSYILVFAVILFVVLLKRFISRYVAGLLFSMVIKAIWKDLDKKSFTNLVVQPLGIFLITFISIITLHGLIFPRLLEIQIYKYSTSQIVHAIATIILIISFIRLLLRIIDFISLILKKKAERLEQADNQLIVFFKDFFKVLIIIQGVLMVLHFAFGFELRNLLTGLSLVGAALALSLRESLENLIASFVIFFDKPFATGDVIKVQNITGTIEKIGLRSTRLRTDQKTYVSVPNKQMVDTIIDNLSMRSQRKAELKLEIGLSTSSQQLEELIEGIRKVMARKEIESSSAFLNDISGTAFIIQNEYFTAPITMADFNTIREEITLQILKLMEHLNISVAGASTDIHILK